MSKHNTLVSVVTPVYNRAKLLKKCWESLAVQTDKDFEWIVVDDGSTDGSAETIRNLPDAGFPVTLVEKENGGKHTALNAAHPYINGQYVLILDSDDRLVETAIGQIREGWQRFHKNEEIGIITFLRGKNLNDPFCKAEDEGVPVDIMRYRRTCFHSSDCCEVIRAELFLKYPFPVFEGERFISEGPLWNRVSFTHKCVYINRVIYLTEYLEGGLTRSGRALRIRNPKGGMFMANLNMNRKNFLKRRIKYGLLYTAYGFFAKAGIQEMIRQNDSKLLTVLCLPGGWLLYRYWKRKYL